MKRRISVFLCIVLLGVTLITQLGCANEARISYREVYLNYARGADDNSDNQLDKQLSGLIMVDLNVDGIPEILGYSQTVTPVVEDDGNVAIIRDCSIEKAFAIEEGKVVSQDYKAPMASLPGEEVDIHWVGLCEINYCNRDNRNYFVTYDGSTFGALTYVGGGHGFEGYTAKEWPNDYNSETYSYVDLPMEIIEIIGYGTEKGPSGTYYDVMKLLLDKYEEKTIVYNSKMSDWAKGEVKYAVQRGFVPQEMYGKDLTKPVTRAEFAAISVKVSDEVWGNEPYKAEKSKVIFTDVEEHEYAEYIEKAYDTGITKGDYVADDVMYFSPDEYITRQDATTMLCRIWTKSPGAVNERSPLDSLDIDGVELFADDSEIAGYAKKAVYFFRKKEIVNGVDESHFAPLLNMSREEAIAVAARMYNEHRWSSLTGE